MRREPLLSPLGLPCTAPPWGTLVSIDLRRNRIAWQVPLGSTENLAPWFAAGARLRHARTWAARSSPPATWCSSARAMDSYFRAFDIETGRELWKIHLPAGGQATPMTYRAGQNDASTSSSRPAATGRSAVPRGDYVIAFALPKAPRKSQLRDARNCMSFLILSIAHPGGA